MGKDIMAVIPIAPGTPAYVENFRYQDGGLEKNVQDEVEARFDHVQVSRVVNWEIKNEALYGLIGWTPTDSLLLYVSSDNLFVTEGLAYIGGSRFLEAGAELFSAADPATDTYYVYLKYTFASDTFEYEYSTSQPTDTDLVKYLMLGTADWSTVTKFWTNPVDLRSSNTSLGAPATISGSDAGPILTVENTGAGSGILSKGDIQVGQSGATKQLIIQGDGTKALTIYNSAFSVEAICSAADTLKIQTIAGADAELIVKTLNGMVVASGIISTGEWQGTVIAKAYLAAHDHTAVGEGGNYAWADITGGITSTPADAVTDTAIDANWAYDHAVGQTVNLHTKLGTIASGVWQATDIGVAYGGLGLSNPTDHAILVGSGSSPITTLSIGTTGQVLISGGTGADPSWASSLTVTGLATGTLVVSGNTTLNGAMQAAVNWNGQDIENMKIIKGGPGTESSHIEFNSGLTGDLDYRCGDASGGHIWRKVHSGSTTTTLMTLDINGHLFMNAGGYFKTSGRFESTSDPLNLRVTGNDQATLAKDITFEPYSDHLLDLGSTSRAWDVVHRQSEVTTSFVGTFDNPIQDILNMKWYEDEHLDHVSLPERIRTLKIKARSQEHFNERITKLNGPPIKGKLNINKTKALNDSINVYEFISDEHYDVDGLAMLTIQALQKALIRINELETRINKLEAGS